MPLRFLPADPKRPTSLVALMFACFLMVVAGCVNAVDERWRMYNDMGVQDFARGNYRDALDEFDLALTFRPQDPVLAYNAAQCYDRLGDVRKAEESYTQCLLINGKQVDANHALISLLYRTGRKQQAIDRIQDWLTREPNSPDPYVADAWRLRQENDLPDAQGRLQQALALDPHHVRALADLGIVYQQLGRLDRARALYERVLEQDKTQVEVSERLEQLKAKGNLTSAPTRFDLQIKDARSGE